MGKIIIWNIASLDGYFEGPEPWDLALHETVWGDELHALSLAQHKDAEALVFGRKTYEGMASYWRNETGDVADDMNRLRKYGVSTTLETADWAKSQIFAGEPISALADLKRTASKNFYVFGSAELVASLLEAGLVDEYRLCIAPLLLGRGNRLFKPSDKRIDLKRSKTQPLKGGGIILYYDVVA